MESDGALRRISWSDLRCRLEAARDLRGILHEMEGDRLTSFDAHSARRLAARADGRECVNPDDLAHGKGKGCNDHSALATATGRDPRE